MNRKTALQQVLDKLPGGWIDDTGTWIDEYTVREIIESLLPVEREGIEDAFHHGKNDSFEMFEDQYSDYFAQTYLSETGEVEQSDEEADKTFVKLSYPNASYVFSVTHSKIEGRTERYFIRKINSWDKDYIGEGNTPQAAWADAAQRIRNSKK